MTLHWLRKHRRTVLIPLTVVIIVTFVFMFGGGGKLKGGPGRTVATVEGRRITVGEFFAVEKALVTLTGQDIRTDDPVLIHFVKALVAEKAGVRPSSIELRQVRGNRFASLVRKPDYTPVELRRELRRRRVTEAELARVIEEDLAWGKLNELLASSTKLTTNELYLALAREEQSLTILYRDFRVAHYEATVEIGEEAIRKYYEQRESSPPSAAPELFTEPEADVTVLFAPQEAFAGGVTVEEAELRDRYDRRKEFFYRKEEGEGYRPFDEVKAEIEKELRRERASAVARKELEKAVEEFNRALDSGASPRVEEHAREGLQVVSRVGVEPSGLEGLGPAGDCRELSLIFDERSRTELGGALSALKPVENGWAAVRVVSFRPPELRSFEEAKEEIAARLRKTEARRSARKDALGFISRWRKNEVDESKDMERRGPVGPDDEVASGFAYLAAGEVSDPIPVGVGEEGMLYRVARLVSRELRSREDFKPDEELRRKSLGARYAFVSRWFRSYLDAVEWGERNPVHRSRREAD